MKKKLLLLSYAVLFAGVSIYFGTGWSTVIFQYPALTQLNVGNYYLHFVPQVAAATTFFTVLVPLMCLVCLVMLKAEWHTRYRFVPIVVLLAILAASAITYFLIFPINREMAAHITDPQQLSAAIGQWVRYTWYRVVLWSIEWLTLMYYFAARAREALERT
ncbi:MAG TPA: hypothetical protein VF525_10695 [Pyrinomonadaceae bacterium]|jgi:MFS superfamily sulfate permease-like transporter